MVTLNKEGHPSIRKRPKKAHKMCQTTHEPNLRRGARETDYARGDENFDLVVYLDH